MNQPPKPWLVNGVLRRDTLVLLTAKPKVAKSLLSLDLAQSVASGEDWHGRAVQQGNVLYIAAEGADLLGPRARALEAKNRCIPSESLRVVQARVPFSDQEAAMRLVESQVEGFEPALVVIDTAARCLDGSEIDSASVTRFCSNIDLIRERCGATVLLLHHHSKGRKAVNGVSYGDSEYRGSTAWEASVSAWFTLVKSSDGKQVTLEPRSGYQRYDFSISFEFESITMDALGELEEEPVLRIVSDVGAKRRKEPKKTVEDYMQVLMKHGGLGKNEWGRHVGDSNSHNRNTIIAKCLRDELVTLEPGPKNSHLYRPT